MEEGGAVGVEGGEGAVGPGGAIAIQDPCTIEGFTLGLHVINFRRSFDLCFQPKSQYHQVTFSWVEVQNRIQPRHLLPTGRPPPTHDYVDDRNFMSCDLSFRIQDPLQPLQVPVPSIIPTLRKKR